MSAVPSKLKFRLNYKPINYDVKTGMFEVNSEKFTRYEEARANHWRCDKCGNRFSTFKKLRKHKKDIHAYWRGVFELLKQKVWINIFSNCEFITIPLA